MRISRVLSPSQLTQRSCGGGGPFLWDGCCQPPRAAYPGLSDRSRSARAAPRPLFGLAPSGVCLAVRVTTNAVVSYTAVSPLPVSSRTIGGLFSVALSVASRRPAVSRHSALWSSDFPRLRHPVRGCLTSGTAVLYTTAAHHGQARVVATAIRTRFPSFQTAHTSQRSCSNIVRTRNARHSLRRARPGTRP